MGVLNAFLPGGWGIRPSKNCPGGWSGLELTDTLHVHSFGVRLAGGSN